MTKRQQSREIYDRFREELGDSLPDKEFRDIVVKTILAGMDVNESSAKGLFRIAHKAWTEEGSPISEEPVGDDTDPTLISVTEDLTRSTNPDDYMPWCTVNKKNEIVKTASTKGGADSLATKTQRVMTVTDALGLEEK